jgi:hypothetical protein
MGEPSRWFCEGYWHRVNHNDPRAVALLAFGFAFTFFGEPILEALFLLAVLVVSAIRRRSER